MGNTAFFWDKKLMERWYLLITEKFLFRWWEMRSFFQRKSWWKYDIYLASLSSPWYSRTWEIRLFVQCKFVLFLLLFLPVHINLQNKLNSQKIPFIVTVSLVFLICNFTAFFLYKFSEYEWVLPLSAVVWWQGVQSAMHTPPAKLFSGVPNIRGCQTNKFLEKYLDRIKYCDSLLLRSDV